MPAERYLNWNMQDFVLWRKILTIIIIITDMYTVFTNAVFIEFLVILGRVPFNYKLWASALFYSL